MLSDEEHMAATSGQGAERLTDLGPLPAQLQNYTIYSSALLPVAASKDAPKAFVAFMKRPDAASFFRKIGMDPS